jgi:FkbM family methyltransferase
VNPLEAMLRTWRRSRRRARRAARSQHRFLEALLDVGPGDILVDCGANVGLYTRHMARSGAFVHAFEPDPTAFAALHAALGEAPNVTLHDSAVGLENGEATLHRAADFAVDPIRRTVASSLLAPTGAAGDAFTVRVVDFPAFLRALPQAPKILKLDIEGVEVALIEALVAQDLARTLPDVYVETHERQRPELRARTYALIDALGRESGGAFDFDWG